MILVGVDGSAPSRAALRWGVKRGLAAGEDVLLAHVLDDEWGVIGSNLMDEMKVEAAAILSNEADYARSIGPEIRLDTLLLSGNPMWELVSVSADASLVAVGTHKTGFVRGRVFGSRSLQLAGASHAPVAVVPESTASSHHGIVVGVNESPASEHAVRFAAEEAHRGSEELVIVGARPTEAFESDGDVDAPERQRAAFINSRIEKVLLRARDQARALHPELTVRVRHVSRRPAEALIEISAAAVMLVIGNTRQDAAPTVLGTIAHDVLINLSAPTVIVHAPEVALSRTSPIRVGRMSAEREHGND